MTNRLADKLALDLLRNIDPDTAPEIVHILTRNSEELDLVGLYFSDPRTYFAVVRPILDFAETNSRLYNPEGDGLTDFIVNSLSAFGILDCFLVNGEHREYLKTWFLRNRGLLSEIIGDRNNSDTVKIRIISCFRYFTGEAISEKGLDTVNFSTNEERIYAFSSLHEPYVKAALLGNAPIQIFSPDSIVDFRASTALDALSLSNDGGFERFVLSNIDRLRKLGSIYQCGNSFNLVSTILLSPFSEETRKGRLEEIGLKKYLSLGDFIAKKFDADRLPDTECIAAVTQLRALGYNPHMNDPARIYGKLTFSSDSEGADFIIDSGMSFSDADKGHLLKLFGKALRDESVALRFTDAALSKIERDIDYRSLSPISLDGFSHRFSDAILKKEIVLYALGQKNSLMMKTYETLDSDDMEELLSENEDPEIERRMLSAISKKTDFAVFEGAYVKNLVSEASFAKPSDYIFEYRGIIDDLSNGRGEDRTVESIISNSELWKFDIVKVGNFARFLIDNQNSSIKKISLLDLFLDKLGISDLSNSEFAEVVTKDVVTSTIFDRRDALKRFIEDVEATMKRIGETDEGRSGNETTGFLTGAIGEIGRWLGSGDNKKSDAEKLRNAKDSEQRANKLDDKMKALGDTTIRELKTVIGFMEKYRRYIPETEFEALNGSLIAQLGEIEAMIR